MTPPRRVQPEILDSLDPQHPDALHNRRDLRLTNAVMGNHRWLARTLPPLLRPGDRLLELGAGTGELAARLARAGVAVDGLDLWPAPDHWPASLTWHRADVRCFDGYDHYTVFIANLLLHQFPDPELAALGAALRLSARLIVACEPSRRRRSQVLYRVIAPLLGANPVTLHDAHVSIAAGFRGDELPRALALPAAAWTFSCTSTIRGAYHFIARRRP